MTPRLAICFPAAPTPSGYEMVRRSVHALRAQDCDPSLFEVVVAVDGGEIDGIDHHHPFALRVVKSHRTRGMEDVPHRNHARNAAWRASTAPLCWMLDADFILPPHAVRHALAEHDAAIERGLPAVLSPCLWQFGGASTEEWWARSAAWANTDDVGESVRKFNDLVAAWPVWDTKSEPPGPGVFSGFGDMAEDLGRAPSSVSVGLRIQEGMPILWRAFLEGCPFDERYIGWGGDKISLIDVIRGLCREGILDIRVITSVVAMHQPHPTDPAYGNELSRANGKRRVLAKMPIESRTGDWRRRVPGFVDALRKGWAAAAQGPIPPDLGSAGELAPVLDVMAGMAKRRARPDAPIVALGPHAGILAAHLEREGLGTILREPTNAAHAVAVMVDPLDAFTGDHRARCEALGHHLRATLHPTATVVIAQRLDGPGIEGLRPVDLQTQVIKRSMDARTIKAGRVRFTAVSGKL